MRKIRMSVSVDVDVRDGINTLAEMNRVSMNELIVRILTATVQENSAAIESYRATVEKARADFPVQLNLFDK